MYIHTRVKLPSLTDCEALSNVQTFALYPKTYAMPPAGAGACCRASLAFFKVKRALHMWSG